VQRDLLYGACIFFEGFQKFREEGDQLGVIKILAMLVQPVFATPAADISADVCGQTSLPSDQSPSRVQSVTLFLKFSGKEVLALNEAQSQINQLT